MLSQVSTNPEEALCEKADDLESLEMKINNSIRRIEADEASLRDTAEKQKENISGYFSELVTVLRSREQELKGGIDSIRVQKSQFLLEQAKFSRRRPRASPLDVSMQSVPRNWTTSLK